MRLLLNKKGAVHVLRVTITNGTGPKTMKVEGKLSGPWVGELERTWARLRAQAPAESLIADLSEVTFIDSEGKTLLARMLRHGAELRADRLLPRFVINEIKAQAAPKSGGQE